MSLSTEVEISIEQVHLMSVTGRLDDAGLTQLRGQLTALLESGAAYLVVELARVTSCDYRFFEALSATHQVLTDRQGWIRLVGFGSTIRNALDHATPAEFMLVCQAADWALDGLI